MERFAGCRDWRGYGLIKMEGKLIRQSEAAMEEARVSRVRGRGLALRLTPNNKGCLFQDGAPPGTIIGYGQPHRICSKKKKIGKRPGTRIV